MAIPTDHPRSRGEQVLAIVYIGPNNFLVALFIALVAWWFAARWGRPLW